MVRNTSCSSWGLRIDSQHPYEDSQPSVTPVLGHLMPSSDLHEHQAYVCYTYKCAGCKCRHSETTELDHPGQEDRFVGDQTAKAISGVASLSANEIIPIRPN